MNSFFLSLHYDKHTILFFFLKMGKMGKDGDTLHLGLISPISTPSYFHLIYHFFGVPFPGPFPC